MKTIIRKLSTLVVLFFGLFLLIDFVLKEMLFVSVHSLTYTIVQFVGFLTLTMLIAFRKIELT